jgi:hypothetical protein
VTKLEWETLAKKVKAQKTLEKLLRDGPSGISGVSEWEKRMVGRCPFCRKLLKGGERLDAHIYYHHSKAYKEKRKGVQSEMKRRGRLEIDVAKITPMQAALLEAQRRVIKNK